MKNSILNLLRGGVFLFAVIAAFAFTQPIATNSVLHALEDGVWVPIPGLVEEDDYECDPIQSECTATFTNNDPLNGMKTVVSFGEFRRK